MSGVIGATGGKFVLIAATLVFQGRVDQARVAVGIAPGAATSSVAPGTPPRARIAVGIGAMRTRIAAPQPAAQPAGTAVTIGRDVLDANAIAIDFPHHRLRLLSRREAVAQQARMTAIPVTAGPDGTLTVPMAIDGRPAVAATLDLASATAIIAPDVADAPPAGADATGARATIGGVAMAGVPVAAGAQPMVGLFAFVRTTVIFDLGHGRIWVSSAPRR